MRLLINISAVTDHCKAVSNPESLPADWTLRDRHFLTVDSKDICGGVTDHTTTDKSPQFWVADWHHWHGFVSGEPIGFVISTCVITNVVGVTEEEWHCTKSLHTGASPA